MPSKIFRSWGPLLGALLFSLDAFGLDWKDTQWLRLLHYQKKTFGRYLSNADDRNFFLHPEGKSSPKKELEALIEMARAGDNQVFCRFPARVRWLRQKGLELPEGECPDLAAFRERLAGRSVTVVFSSYYLNNPGSSFGHTFLRINKDPELKANARTSSELLDTGISYGASTGNAGALLYTIGGLSGWFPGTFNAIPYYYKVREYNDFETRDLWSYQLDLTQAEVDMVVDHIWELGQTSFDYFFLTENCAQMVLAILEAARPSLHLIDRLPYLYTIPSDTLQVLDEEGLIQSVTYRPSASTVFYRQLEDLDESEREVVRTLVRDEPVALETLPPEKRALVLDTAISLVDYKHAKELLKQDERAQELKRPLLVQRSKVPLRSPDLDFSDRLTLAPHLGHGSRRLTLGSSRLEDRTSFDLEWRFAFHDFLDYDLGYPPRTNIEVGKIHLRSDGRSTSVEELLILDVQSLGKWDVFTSSPSWKFKLGHWQTLNEGEKLSTQGVAGGYGYSYHFRSFAPYALAAIEASYVSEELRKLKIAYGGDFGFLVDFSRNLKLHSVLELRAWPWIESSWFSEVRYSNRSFGVGAFHRSWLQEDAEEFGGKLFLYF